MEQSLEKVVQRVQHIHIHQMLIKLVVKRIFVINQEKFNLINLLEFVFYFFYSILSKIEEEFLF